MFNLFLQKQKNRRHDKKVVPPTENLDILLQVFNLLNIRLMEYQKSVYFLFEVVDFFLDVVVFLFVVVFLDVVVVFLCVVVVFFVVLVATGL